MPPLKFVADVFRKFSSTTNLNSAETDFSYYPYTSSDKRFCSGFSMAHPSFRQKPLPVIPESLYGRKDQALFIKRKSVKKNDLSSGYEELSVDFSDDRDSVRTISEPVSRISNGSSNGSSGFHDDELFPSCASTGAIIWCEVDTHGDTAGPVTVRVRCRCRVVHVLVADRGYLSGCWSSTGSTKLAKMFGWLDRYFEFTVEKSRRQRITKILMGAFDSDPKVSRKATDWSEKFSGILFSFFDSLDCNEMFCFIVDPYFGKKSDFKDSFLSQILFW